MSIGKEEDDLILRIPLTVISYDAIGQDIGRVPNLVGVSTGKEFHISYRIDMAYKGKDAQEGMPVIMFDDYEELEAACTILGLELWEVSRE